MAAEDTNRDLVLAPNEQAAILDETKGNVSVYVGPQKTSLSTSDKPVVFDPETQRFQRCNQMSDAVQLWPFAREGDYIVLQNPAPTGANKEHPTKGSANSLIELEDGRRVNILGPATFPLWPGQIAEVVHGHRLRTSEFLIVEVYNDEAAKANWGQSVMKRQTALVAAPSNLEGGSGAEAQGQGQQGDNPSAPEVQLSQPAAVISLGDEVPELTVGQRLIIPGTQVSFYMPPTGVSVVKNDDGKYVRQAVTLERLEYCILINEDGNKRYVIGPAVVFPEPTETFVVEGADRKFRAIELSPISGLYIKVIARYTEGDQTHEVGEERFITGDNQPIYYPRPEHAVIKYGEREVHHAVAIPEGEGRYVLNRMTGVIELVKGPKMYLPDPRTQVFVRRILTNKDVELWFPGNTEARSYNAQLASQLAAMSGREGTDFLTEREFDLPRRGIGERLMRGAMPPERAGGDELRRSETFSPPRTVTLDTKYEGAVTIQVWPEYAVMIVKRSGQRRVVTGPATVLLEYDESLQSMELSTGTPKSDENTIKTAYLLVRGNRVSDEVVVETRDLVQVRLRVSYRVNFEGVDQSRWFAADNYIKLLTEHLRSLIRGHVKGLGIQEFYDNSTAKVRDMVLGGAVEGQERPGKAFAENGMRVYDLEVLDVTILDRAVSTLLQEAQRESVENMLKVASAERNRDATVQLESIEREVLEAQDETAEKHHKLSLVALDRTAEVQLARVMSEARAERTQQEAKEALQEILDAIQASEVARRQSMFEVTIGEDKERQGLRLEILKAEVDGIVAKATAITPQLVAALQAFADKDLLAKLSENLGSLAVIDRVSIGAVAQMLFHDTPLAPMLEKFGEIIPVSPNGHRALPEAAATAD